MEDAFREAVTAGDLSVVRRMLEQHPALASSKDDGVSVVRVALYRGQVAVAEALVTAGADLDAFDAAAVGEVGVLRIAIDLDPLLVERWSDDGFQALHLAAFFGHADAVRVLVGAGAPVDEASLNTMRVHPLHSAAAANDPDARLAACLDLLDAGADPNAVQQGGFTALHAAAQHGDELLARLLVDRGADLTRLTEDGRTAATLAVEHGHLALAALLTPS
jgi:uncharacterized protein